MEAGGQLPGIDETHWHRASLPGCFVLASVSHQGGRESCVTYSRVPMATHSEQRILAGPAVWNPVSMGSVTSGKGLGPSEHSSLVPVLPPEWKELNHIGSGL